MKKWRRMSAYSLIHTYTTAQYCRTFIFHCHEGGGKWNLFWSHNLPIHSAEEGQIEHGAAVASINNGMKPSPTRKRTDDGGVDLIVYDHSLRFKIKRTKCFIVSVHFIGIVAPLLRAMARVVKHQRVSGLATLNQPIEGHSDILLGRNLEWISFFLCVINHIITRKIDSTIKKDRIMEYEEHDQGWVD